MVCAVIMAYFVMERYACTYMHMDMNIYAHKTAYMRIESRRGELKVEMRE